MTIPKTNNTGSATESWQQRAGSHEQGDRQPSQQAIVTFIATVALSWSLFQIWIASPLPFVLGWGVFSSGEARNVHLAFALLLAFLVYPAYQSSSRRQIPLTDWILAIIASCCALYPLLADSSLSAQIWGIRLSDRPGAPNVVDITAALLGLSLLLEATRRALGPALVMVALIFLAYTFFGAYAPDLIAWKGSSFAGVIDQQWLFSEGVFGIALGVSTNLVFLFVLFGALLEKAGAGNYFIKVAFSLLGHLRGGPAKAAVVGSGMTGLISGSSIANVVTTGTFTIPMMKKVGFSAEKAGAVEVASSVNGQIMPPVMGAAAFLMVEYTDLPYFEVVKHAFLPALIAYIALVYIVHLEAEKSDLPILAPFGDKRSIKVALLAWGLTLLPLLICAAGAYYLSEIFVALQSDGARLAIVAGLLIGQWAVFRLLRQQSNAKFTRIVSIGALVLANSTIVAFGLFWLLAILKASLSEQTLFALIVVLILITYVILAKISSAYPDLVLDDPKAPMQTLPQVKPTLMAGLHFFLPVLVLIWCLMVERKSPSLSAFYASLLMMFIVLTQRALLCFFRQQNTRGAIRCGVNELVAGLIAGARNMVAIGIATAAAGIIVGAVAQTGIGLKLAALVEFLSMGHILLILVWTALLSLILGMGLPTTANYIVVSSLMAPVIITLGQQNGLLVPLIAIHMFVFYFGVMADVTPPVGLASFAAAAISGGAPIRTGLIAFFYSLRTAILPFLFIFNTDLLLIDVSLTEGIVVFIISTLAMLIFTAASQGYLLTHSKWHESVALLLIAFTLFRPGFWLDKVIPAYQQRDPSQLMQTLGEVSVGTQLRVNVVGQDSVGAPIPLVLLMTVSAGEGAQERLQNYGLELWPQNDGSMMVDGIGFDSAAAQAGFDFDQVIQLVEVPTERPAKQWFYLPALILFVFILWRQKRRLSQ